MAEHSYRVDPNHSSLRLVVIISMAVALLLGLFGAPALLRGLGVQGAGLLLGAIIGIVLAALAATVSERILRGRWPSGRTLVVSDEAITLHEKTDSVTLRWDEGINVWAWTFAIAGRRSWVPRGWLCVAMRLMHGDDAITPYAFMPPQRARELEGWNAFVELIPRKEADGLDPALLASQEHLRGAEEERWWIGAEMEPDDFAELVGVVAGRVDHWPERRR